MPHVIFILTGAADDALDALDGRTPLQAAELPGLRRLAEHAEAGLVRLLPEAPDDDPAIGCDQTVLALLGYDAAPHSRGALELLGAGASLGNRDLGLRLDLLHTAGGLDRFPAPPTAEEARALWPDLIRACARRDLQIRGVRPDSGLGLWNEGPGEVLAVPPGELTAEPLDRQLPQGDRDAELRRLIDDAREVLADHPVNVRRRAAAQPTFDALWPWGFGRAPQLPLFVLRTGQLATLLTPNLAARGAARAVGVHAQFTPELRGLTEADQPGQLPRGSQAAAAVLGDLDHAPTVLVQYDSADRAGHRGDAERKVAALREWEQHLLEPVLRHAEVERQLAITILVDYACCTTTRRHANRAVPYLHYRADRRTAGPREWHEASAAETGRRRTGARDLDLWLWSG